MRHQSNRERWLHDLDARQRNVVFPDTVKNEGRFWRNLGKDGWTPTIAIALLVLGILVFGRLAVYLIILFKNGANVWALGLATLFFAGGFGLIAWATRRTLRRIEDSRRDSRSGQRQP